MLHSCPHLFQSNNFKYLEKNISGFTDRKFYLLFEVKRTALWKCAHQDSWKKFGVVKIN